MRFTDFGCGHRDDRDDHEVFARAGACVGSETLEGGIMARLIRNLDS